MKMILGLLLITALGFSQGSLFGNSDTDVSRSFRPFQPRENNIIQRCLDGIKSILQAGCKLIFKIIAIPFLLVRIILLPITLCIKGIMWLIRLPFLPIRLFNKFLRYIFGRS